MNISIKWKKRVIRSNLQGLSNIVRADSSLFQFVWFFFYIISSLVTVFLIGQSILKFMKCKVDANVRRNIVTQLDFPKITFCNRNPLSSDYFLDLYRKANVPLHKFQYYMLLPLESYMRNTSGRYLTLAEKQNMTDLKGLVISCMFKNKPCPLKEDLIFIYEPYYQNCIRFNSGFDSAGRFIGSKKVHSTSEELSIEFYVGLPNQITEFYPNKCLLVWVHDFSTNLNRMPEDEFKFTAGFDVDLKISPYVYKQFNQWPFGYSECTVDEENRLLKPLSNSSLFDRVYAEKITYSRTRCLYFCFQEIVAQKCGCIDFWPNITIAGYDYCLDNKANCSHDFFYQVFFKNDFIDKNCLDRCPAECVTQSFHYQLAYQQYPQASYVEKTLKTNPMLIKKYANQSDFESNLARSVLRLTIRFDSLAYKEIVEEPRMSWKSLLGELGGDLHIFFGMSLISFIDAFELIRLFFSDLFRSFIF